MSLLKMCHFDNYISIHFLYYEAKNIIPQGLCIHWFTASKFHDIWLGPYRDGTRRRRELTYLVPVTHRKLIVMSPLIDILVG